MAYTVARLKVQDFAKFKEGFTAGAALRKSYGSLGAQMFQSASDPNEVVLVFEWESLERATDNVPATGGRGVSYVEA